ncbi:cyclin-like protein [Sporormia fimetaria CBS 119925]|uniref:RNA polymerase II holoenzyme cyclin-like subunit n=1 Tax=Sporormia fimetaria CBS 119925 TaxID=1340428 RepID=A0A6A6VKH5_9PLEO|nr:cyclin-like protein [Sporormia fimetaria CBS 119925]
MAASPRIGPDPSYVHVAQSYLTQRQIDRCLVALNTKGAREDAARLQGVAWIDSVRRSLQLPIRTYNTACIYYHKFRLKHAEPSYNWADASAAALFAACKIEDTLKKSRDILCAHYNLKKSPGEMLAPDDARFEGGSKVIIGLERMMLEAAGFDFRTRHPGRVLVKVGRRVGFEVEKEGRTSWHVALDAYRTFAPLKQTASTVAFACLEVAARLHGRGVEGLVEMRENRRWGTSRAEVMETILDLLDLYTHYRTGTIVGPMYPLETFISIRIQLNEEAAAKSIPRFADTPTAQETNGVASSKPTNGTTATSTSPDTPLSPNTIPPTPRSAGTRNPGTVRYMLDPSRAREEREIVERYFREPTEETEDVEKSVR